MECVIKEGRKNDLEVGEKKRYCKRRDIVKSDVYWAKTSLKVGTDVPGT